MSRGLGDVYKRQMLDGFVDKIRCRGDKLSQAAGQRAQGCGRKMHTSGPQQQSKIFKFIAKSLMNTLFEQLS